MCIRDSFTGMDALAHNLEAFCATGFHPMADGIAIEGIKLIKDSLPIVFKDGKNLKTLGIWDNQINMYKRISDRTSRESINKSINTLDGIDKCFKGVLNGDPWNGIKDIVLELSG